MSLSPDRPQSDWNPRSEVDLDDQIAAYDAMRRRCPVAYSDYLGWSLFRHEDVVRVLDDHDTFSSVVSSHLSVPSGMDPPRHTAYRALIDHHFAPERVAAFEPLCRSISAGLVAGLERGAGIDLAAQLARPFAVEIQCAYLGWPTALHEPLLRWVRRNHEATLARDTEAMAAIALEFDGYIAELLDVHRAAGPAAPDDITTDLLRQEIDGRPLGHDEIVSILRNWTVGELGTMGMSGDAITIMLRRCRDAFSSASASGMARNVVRRNDETHLASIATWIVTSGAGGQNRALREQGRLYNISMFRML